jgi:glycine/D-amino acid oxidase-like deaminating enzyme
MKMLPLLTAALVGAGLLARAEDWPQWGGNDPGRNMYSPAKGLPDRFEPGKLKSGTEEIDLATTKNVKWVAKLGSQSYANPVVAGGKVFVGTNGYTGAVTPTLRRRTIPVASHMIATEELDPALAASLIPKGRFLSETKRVLCYYRLSPDGRRVLFGGRPRFTQVAPETSARLLHELMVERFPQLAGVRVAHNWMGNLAFAFDQLPHMGEQDGLYYAMCCNGSGVAMLGWLGQQSARKMIGGANRQNAFDGRPFETLPLYDGRPWFLPIVGAWYRHLDRREREAAAREVP